MAEVSLCVIARDEAALLGGCLASVAGVVDEIVVVDTGSVDATAPIAARAGARVVAHAWSDSFADARNAAVRRARGRFVLVLDADERLAAAGRDAVRAVVAAGDLDAGFLPLHHAARLDASEDAVLSGSARRGEPLLLPRLLRRTADLRWEGLVHEHVDAWLAHPGRRLRAVPAPIVHLGCVDALRGAREKGARNRRLLERARDAAPCALRPRVELVRELLLAGAYAEARDEAEAAWALLAASSAAEAAPCLVALATLHAWIALRDARLADAAATLERAASRGAAHPNLDLLRGHCFELEALGLHGEARRIRLQRARDCFARCLRQAGHLSTETLSPGATSWSAATRLGTVLLLLGEPAAAREAFALALAARPELLEARLGHAEALLDGGAAGAALAESRPLLERGRADGWLLAVAACRALGRADEMWALLADARRFVARGFVAPHRHERLVGFAAALAA